MKACGCLRCAASPRQNSASYPHFTPFFVKDILTIFGILLFSVFAASAESQLVLENGDVISGDIVSKTKKHWIIQHPVLGKLKILRKNATLVGTFGTNPESDLLEQLPASEPTPPPPPTPVLAVSAPINEGSDAKPQIPDEPREIPASPESIWNAAERALRFIAHNQRPSWYPQLPDNWNGNLKFGFTYNDRETLSTQRYGEIGIEGKTDHFNHRFGGFYLFSDQGGIQSDNRWGSSYRARFTATELTFFQSLSSYEVDNLKDPEQKVIQSLGVGTKLINQSSFSIDTVIGGAAEYRDMRTTADSTIFKLSLSEELRWRFNDSLQFKQSVSILVEPNDFSRYTLTFDSSVETPIIGALNLELAYRYDFDSTLLDKNARKNTRIVTSLGLKF